MVDGWSYVAPGSSIQTALNNGDRAILLGAGTYNITSPIVVPTETSIRGISGQTKIVATAAINEVFAIGNGGAVSRVDISNLIIDCDGNASEGIDINIVGTSGFYQGEPDSICRLDNIVIYDPITDGIVYRGTDTQACITSRVRVRRAGRYAYRVEAPDNWFSMCEGTTASSTGSSAVFYVGVAIAGSNGSGGSNNEFHGCKAWYARDYGWHVKGTRNRFISCEAQDTKLHGFYIEWDKNVFVGCIADTAGMYDVGGTTNTADGFYVAGGTYTSIVGCQAFDRKPSGHAEQQRYGFNVPTSMVTDPYPRFVGPSGFDNDVALINLR